MNELKYAGLNGSWKKVWPEAVTCRLERHQPGISSCKPGSLGRVLCDFEGLHIQEIFVSHAGNLTEEDLEQVTVVREPEDELCDAVMES